MKGVSVETNEIESFRDKCEDIKRIKKIDANTESSLRELLSDRYDRALDLAKKRAVKKYTFTPSGRVMWIIKGKKRMYQVIPSSNFCSCDDFYFRVLDKKKQMCYHLVAQGLAAVLNRYDDIELPDIEYETVTKKFKRKTT